MLPPRRHLETFDSWRGGKGGKGGRGRHVFARGRAWHRGGDDLTYVKARDQALSTTTTYKYVETHTCDEVLTAPPFRDAQSVWLETQDDYARAYHRMHPMPYVGSVVAPSPRRSGDFGDGWFRRTDGGTRRRFRVVALFTIDDGKAKDPSRALLHEQCRAHPDCRTTEELGSARAVVHGVVKEQMRSIPFEAYNRASDFCLQPPGHSAVRKGIVDALLSGCVPVLVHQDDVEPGAFRAHDQPDVWPWQWPWQYASSIALSPNDIAKHGLMTLLDRVDDKQLELMRRVIAELAPNLAYPLALDAAHAPPDDRAPEPPFNALDLAMHHLFYVSRAVRNATRAA